MTWCGVGDGYATITLQARGMAWPMASALLYNYVLQIAHEYCGRRYRTDTHTHTDTQKGTVWVLAQRAICNLHVCVTAVWVLQRPVIEL